MVFADSPRAWVVLDRRPEDGTSFTSEPTALVADAILDCSKRGDIGPTLGLAGQAPQQHCAP
jgi:hypothetical protein